MPHDITKARLHEVLGPAGFDALIAAFGGRAVYIPARLPADHRLSQVVGFEAAGRLQRAFGAGAFAVPIRPQVTPLADRIRVLKADGRPATEIARALGCTVRTVYRHLSRDSVRVPKPGGDA